MIYQYKCTLCSTPECPTRCIVETGDEVPPFDCPYAEYNEHGNCITIGSDWKLVSFTEKVN